MNQEGPRQLSPARRARLAIREGRHRSTTRGVAMGYVQCNLVALPRALSADFLLYCQRNSVACPVLEVTEPGDHEPRLLAPGADLRTDIPLYSIYRNGNREADRQDLIDLWNEDIVAFLIGSGISFDDAFERAGIPTDAHRWVVRTGIPTVAAGPFHGPLVATMRWLTPRQAIAAVVVSSRFARCHGAPIHIGDPELIGADVVDPLFGGPVPTLPRGLIPVFWACGVTPQLAAISAKVGLMMTHSAGHGFITDVLAEGEGGRTGEQENR